MKIMCIYIYIIKKSKCILYLNVYIYIYKCILCIYIYIYINRDIKRPIESMGTTSPLLLSLPPFTVLDRF